MKSVMELTLAEICDFVAARRPFDGKNYEELARNMAQVSAPKYEALRLKFAIQHIFNELSEAAGDLGRFSEQLDRQSLESKVRYLESCDSRKLLAAAVKMLLLNVVRLIEVASLDAYLSEEFFFWASKHQPVAEKKD